MPQVVAQTVSPGRANRLILCNVRLLHNSEFKAKCYRRYQAVLVTKYRCSAIYGTLRKPIGGIFRVLCRRQGTDIIEDLPTPVDIQLTPRIPLKYSENYRTGFQKGNCAIRIRRECLSQKRN